MTKNMTSSGLGENVIHTKIILNTYCTKWCVKGDTWCQRGVWHPTSVGLYISVVVGRMQAVWHPVSCVIYWYTWEGIYFYFILSFINSFSITCLRVLWWSLSSASYPTIRMSSAIPNTFGRPLKIYWFSSGTCHLMVLLQRLVWQTCSCQLTCKCDYVQGFLSHLRLWYIELESIMVM